MSAFDYLFSFTKRVYSEVLQDLFTVKAEEKVPCINQDGTLGEMVVCTNDEGDRIPCPCGDRDLNEEEYEEEEPGACAFGYGMFGYNMAETAAKSPSYGDLGKEANDVFSKGYNFGMYKLDLKTKSEAGVEFTSGINSNHESGKVTGNLSSKYSVKDYGLSFTEKWNTDNTLGTDITIADKLAQGLSVTLEGTFAPQSGAKTGKLKTSFARETVSINTMLDLDMGGPIVDVAAVLHHKGWLGGFNSQFDSKNAKFNKNNFALGYKTKDFALHTNVNNGKDFGGSIFQKVSDKINCGISMNWTAGAAETNFGVGFKYQMDPDASLHAKINNKALIGLGYQQKLKPGVTITLSCCIDGQNFNGGGHKVGLALDLAP